MSLSFPMFPFAILDTETTGLTPRSDRILELAIVRYEKGKKVAEYETLFSIPDAIPKNVQVLTRIRQSDIAGKPTIKEEKARIESILQSAVLIGHNIPFDLGMLAGEGIDVAGTAWIDSAMLASMVFPDLKSWSLGYLSSVIPLPHAPMHRAMGDVHATEALFQKIWSRLSEIPQEMLEQIRHMSEKGPEGYATLFSALKNESIKIPLWLKEGKTRLMSARSPDSLMRVLMEKQEEGVRVWGVVKNVDVLLRSMDNESLEKYSVLHAPPYLLNPASESVFLSQDIFTPYEFTLAAKLVLFAPRIQSDFPIHSDEREVWKGKVSCSQDSPHYQNQLKDAGDYILIDHRQLLELIQRGNGPKDGEKIIIDDASMLEDTATKAMRWAFSIETLRAAAEGDEVLTGFLDAYQIWTEKVRNFQDIRYLVDADLKTKDAKGLRERLETLISSRKELPHQELILENLYDLEKILSQKNLNERITWIEQFRDGGQILQSVPYNVASSLQDELYQNHPTSLIVPPGETKSFAAILPSNAPVELIDDVLKEKSPLRYSEPEMTIERLLPCIDGRVIVLVSSKRLIEQFYIDFAEQLESEGIQLITQSFSGGLGRMQAEFLAGGDRTVWILTPWLYESVELPPESVDYLWIHTLPFDHPSHAVLARRSERYGDAFNDYLIPRLLHRLFRIIRTFTDHRTKAGSIVVFDQRLRTKNYGEKVRGYLNEITVSFPE